MTAIIPRSNVSAIARSTQVSGGLSINSMDDLNQLGAMLSKSGFFPDCRDAAQACAKILAGLEIGVPAFSAMGGVHIIKGKASIGAKLLAAKIKSSSKYNYRVLEHTTQICKIQFYENGQESGVSEFTIAEATAAGLTNNPTWKSYPKNMLFARAISQGQAFYCPDVLMGSDVQVMAEEELSDRANSQRQYIPDYKQSDEWFNFQQMVGVAIRSGDRAGVDLAIAFAHDLVNQGGLPQQARSAIDREEQRAREAVRDRGEVRQLEHEKPAIVQPKRIKQPVSDEPVTTEGIGEFITEKERSLLWEAAKKSGYTAEGFGRLVKMFGFASSKEITIVAYEGIFEAAKDEELAIQANEADL
jgi:hypothetical protein